MIHHSAQSKSGGAAGGIFLPTLVIVIVISIVIDIVIIIVTLTKAKKSQDVQKKKIIGSKSWSLKKGSNIFVCFPIHQSVTAYL